MWWLHEQNYTFHGTAPIAGLTKDELDVLQFGWMVNQEQREQAMNSTSSGGNYSKSRKSSHKQNITRRLREMDLN